MSHPFVLVDNNYDQSLKSSWFINGIKSACKMPMTLQNVQFVQWYVTDFRVPADQWISISVYRMLNSTLLIFDLVTCFFFASHRKARVFKITFCKSFTWQINTFLKDIFITWLIKTTSRRRKPVTPKSRSRSP